MWSLGTSPALFLLVGVLIGFALFIGTLMSAWTNWSDAMIRKATKVSAVIALIAGLIGLSYWLFSSETRADPVEGAVLFAIYVAPAFTISYYLTLYWLRRSIAGESEN